MDGSHHLFIFLNFKFFGWGEGVTFSQWLDAMQWRIECSLLASEWKECPILVGICPLAMPTSKCGLGISYNNLNYVFELAEGNMTLCLNHINMQGNFNFLKNIYIKV